jgi:hypothetical protein
LEIGSTQSLSMISSCPLCAILSFLPAVNLPSAMSISCLQTIGASNLSLLPLERLQFKCSRMSFSSLLPFEKTPFSFPVAQSHYVLIDVVLRYPSIPPTIFSVSGGQGLINPLARGESDYVSVWCYQPSAYFTTLSLSLSHPLPTHE